MILLVLLSLFITGCTTHTTELDCKNSKIKWLYYVDDQGSKETVTDRVRLEAIMQKKHHIGWKKMVRQFSQSGDVTLFYPTGHAMAYLETKNGRAHGSYKEWHSDGGLKVHFHVLAGDGDISTNAQKTWHVDGSALAYYPSGKLRARMAYRDGLLHGGFQIYHEDGSLKEIGRYKDGERVGTHIFFYKGLRVNQRHVYSAKGVIRIGFWENGRLKMYEKSALDQLVRAHYYTQDGFAVGGVHAGIGKKIVWHSSSQWHTDAYQNGLFTGVREYFEKDMLTRREHYRDGMRDGEDLYFYKNGQKKLRMHWEKGVLSGRCTVWRESGTIMTHYMMHKNQMNGERIVYYPDGSIMMVEHYKSGALQSGTYYRYGSSTVHSSVQNGDGEATIFDDKGEIEKTVFYSQGTPLTAS